MAITLDGITLPALERDNEFSRSFVEAHVVRSLGGTPNIWEQSISGRNIDLVGGEDFGWISRAVLLQISALSDVPNAVHTLSYEGSVFTVRFRHEDGAPIEATPVISRPSQADDDWYKNVRIRLMEV